MTTLPRLLSALDSSEAKLLEVATKRMGAGKVSERAIATRIVIKSQRAAQAARNASEGVKR